MLKYVVDAYYTDKRQLLLRCALFIILSVQYLFTAHCTNGLFVGARLAIVRSHLMHLLAAYAMNNKQIN